MQASTLEKVLDTKVNPTGNREREILAEELTQVCHNTADAGAQVLPPEEEKLGDEIKKQAAGEAGKKKRLSRSGVDITGQTFGRLTALEPTDQREKGGSIIWRCICICGNEKLVSQGCLVRGNTVSCGCKKRENNKNIYKQLHFVDGTCIEFLEKRTKRCDNKTGFTGVSMFKNKYRANITFKGRRYYLGTFETLQEAVTAREEAKSKLHGQFIAAYYSSCAEK